MTRRALELLKAAAIFVLLVGALLVFSALRCKAGPAEEFAFLLLLNQAKSEGTPSIDWADYVAEKQAGWPKGAIAFVSSPGCRPCEVVRRDVFTAPAVIEAMSQHVCVEPHEKYYERFQHRGQPGTPFLVAIEPGGDMIRRIPCPQTTEEFLKILPQPPKVK